MGDPLHLLVEVGVEPSHWMEEVVGEEPLQRREQVQVVP